MKPICEYSFRELLNKYVYLAAPKLVKDYNSDANGIVAYVYLNHEEGMCYEPLTMATYFTDSKAMKLWVELECPELELTPNNVKELPAIILPGVLDSFVELQPRIEALTALSICSEELNRARLVKNLDGCRSYENPDIVQVYLAKGEQVEANLARIEGIKEMSFIGTLLQEPHAEFGLHQGDSFSFYLVKNTQGIMCLAVFK